MQRKRQKENKITIEEDTDCVTNRTQTRGLQSKKRRRRTEDFASQNGQKRRKITYRNQKTHTASLSYVMELDKNITKVDLKSHVEVKENVIQIQRLKGYKVKTIF